MYVLLLPLDSIDICAINFNSKKMAQFQIQQASSTVNWTGKKVLGLHTGSVGSPFLVQYKSRIFSCFNQSYWA